MSHTQIALTPQDFFERLNKNTLSLVDEFYDEDVFFQDPLVCLRGRGSVKRYYANMYANVISISWTFSHSIHQDNRYSLSWRMHLTAAQFNRGRPVAVDGVSVFEFNPAGKVSFHRDFFDLGAFVYEWIPCLGGGVRFVKRKMIETMHKDTS